MEKDAYSTFKAKNFLGVFSVRTGLFLIASAQALLGLCLYTILHYLHPSFYYVSCMLLSLQLACGVIGFFGALKRDILLESIYLVLSLISLLFVLMTILDLSELVHFLPKAPEIHNVGLTNIYSPTSINLKLPNAKIMTPLSVYKQPLVPLVLDSKDNENVQPQVQNTTKVDAVAEPLAAKNGQQNDGALNNNPSPSKENNQSLYDNIPFLPHLGETDGETEEVSRDELPPETKDLTPEGQSEVVVLYKLQKRPFKFTAAAFLTLVLLFNIYSYWIAVTFVLNKCTCLDELTSHPEQFAPLID